MSRSFKALTAYSALTMKRYPESLLSARLSHAAAKQVLFLYHDRLETLSFRTPVKAETLYSTV